jgi:hypothetical protein
MNQMSEEMLREVWGGPTPGAGPQCRFCWEPLDSSEEIDEGEKAHVRCLERRDMYLRQIAENPWGEADE